MNCDQNGYEYGFDYNRLYTLIYLKKKEIPVEDTASKGSRMFEILITYNEFLHHPNIFKDFIKSPKRFQKWNFWYKELKYKQEKFDIKFQTTRC